VAVEECLAQRPDVPIATIMRDVVMLARAEDWEGLSTLLRKAGLPE
jgi:hypothetical protein